jgi:ABC-2 type transport system permease protein
MKSILAICRKDITLLVRDKAGFFFTFFFPLLIAIFFGAIFSGQGHSPRSIAVCLVDEDKSDGSGQFAGRLEKAVEFRVIRTTREGARELVRTGKRTAFLILLPGFGNAQKRAFWGEPPTVELGVDPARQAESGMIEGVLMKYASERFQDSFSDPVRIHEDVGSNLKEIRASKTIPRSDKIRFERFLGALDRFALTAPSPAAGEPVQPDSVKSRFQPLAVERVDVGVVRIGPKNSFEYTFPQGIVWGLLGCTAGFGISLITERRRGTLLRLRSAPMERWQILAGKASACFCTTLAMSFLLLIVAILVFRVRPHSYSLLVLSLLSSGFAFTGIMMLMAVLGKTEQSGAGIGWAVNLVFAMIGGGMIPLFVMPPWMARISHLSPVKWAILSMEGAIWRGFSFHEMVAPCGILIGIGIVFFAAGARLFKWEA